MPRDILRATDIGSPVRMHFVDRNCFSHVTRRRTVSFITNLLKFCCLKYRYILNTWLYRAIQLRRLRLLFVSTPSQTVLI